MKEINEFLDAELARSTQTLIAEREAADRMVQYYLALSTALLGGYFYLNIEQKNSLLPIDITLLLLLVWQLCGISVVVRLIKRNLIGRLYRGRVRDARRIKARDSAEIEKIVTQWANQEDSINQVNSLKGKVDEYLGGFGPALILFNSIIFAVFFERLLRSETLCVNVATMAGLLIGIAFQGFLGWLIAKRKIPEFETEPSQTTSAS